MRDGRIASFADDGEIRIWEPNTGACLGVMEGHKLKGVRNVYLLGEKRACSIGYSKNICFWDLDKYECLYASENNSEIVSWLRHSKNDDGRLFTWVEDGTFRIWNIQTCNCELTLSKDATGDIVPSRSNAYLSRNGLLFYSWEQDRYIGLSVFPPKHQYTAVWHGNCRARITNILDNGSLIVSLENGEVVVLHLWYGDKRITISNALRIIDPK